MDIGSARPSAFFFLMAPLGTPQANDGLSADTWRRHLVAAVVIEPDIAIFCIEHNHNMIERVIRLA